MDSGMERKADIKKTMPLTFFQPIAAGIIFKAWNSRPRIPEC